MRISLRSRAVEAIQATYRMAARRWPCWARHWRASASYAERSAGTERTLSCAAGAGRATLRLFCFFVSHLEGLNCGRGGDLGEVNARKEDRSVARALGFRLGSQRSVAAFGEWRCPRVRLRWVQAFVSSG